MSPRRSAAAALQTRGEIVARAVAVASTDGLEGLTIGRLAGDLSMSKAGVIGHFGSKQQLQLDALEEAIAIFTREVWLPIADRPAGRERLLAICEAWIAHLQSGVFPGGCFLTAASMEFDGRDGPVRDRVVAALELWRDVIEHDVRVALDAGDLAPDVDPAQVAFEWNALAVGLNQAIQLFGDPAAPARARRAMHRSLGL
ncbi:TetR family transcriptional regulator [Conexibacter sp. JD483]|uniref:TetR/AcrR family transcriptional regulator n=1 Tax=unclassified Conexibacter TaxID=2627773 RepID=UPI00271ACB44|nr:MULTISPECIES: TetR family transcriptional regulator [unclassified Conexibacter]MDO8184749.1 TetR family transcriptional regulator [Conexibacter sp. CPCC 205706]MDO8196524.1 TetR family transcriptional regulator [Conexibacter sp. CPCC 205762]MDR9369010.1 TetR family transcriptional regulator [Conexibacter sp. JD483]